MDLASLPAPVLLEVLSWTGNGRKFSVLSKACRQRIIADPDIAAYLHFSLNADQLYRLSLSSHGFVKRLARRLTVHNGALDVKSHLVKTRWPIITPHTSDSVFARTLFCDFVQARNAGPRLSQFVVPTRDGTQLIHFPAVTTLITLLETSANLGSFEWRESSFPPSLWQHAPKFGSSSPVPQMLSTTCFRQSFPLTTRPHEYYAETILSDPLPSRSLLAAIVADPEMHGGPGPQSEPPPQKEGPPPATSPSSSSAGGGDSSPPGVELAPTDEIAQLARDLLVKLEQRGQLLQKLRYADQQAANCHQLFCEYMKRLMGAKLDHAAIACVRMLARSASSLQSLKVIGPFFQSAIFSQALTQVATERRHSAQQSSPGYGACALQFFMPKLPALTRCRITRLRDPMVLKRFIKQHCCTLEEMTLQIEESREESDLERSYIDSITKSQSVKTEGAAHLQTCSRDLVVSRYLL